MAMYFNFAANIGEDREKAQKFLDFFKEKRLILSNTQEVPLDGFIQKNDHGEWIVGITPHGMNYGTDTTDVSLLEKPYNIEIKKFFYDCLKDAPSFEYAAFGQEMADYFLVTSTPALCNPSVRPEQLKDFVITNKLWEELRMPKEFTPFKEGYFWNKTLETVT